MKKFILITCFLLAAIVCSAQLRPPMQTDTLIIKSVKYNYSEILEENWPCREILKSTTHFRFGEQTFRIDHVEKSFNDIIYFYLGAESVEKSCLTYNERHDGSITIAYSGYEFVCVLKTKADTHQGSQSYETRNTPNSRLSGRTVIGAIPSPTYAVKEPGRVVVKIKVDRHGTVVDAQPGEAGTNMTDQKAWEAAKKAALKTQFNFKADAPEFQYGAITYTFNITH